MSKFGKFFLLVVMFLSIGSYAYAGKPAPFVDITKPVNNFTTDKNTLAVTVVFGPYRCKHKHEMPNKIDLIVLKIDNIKVAAYDVPKHAKDGSKIFTINISSYTKGSHILKAFAYKDKKGKHQIAKSDPVTFIIKPPTPINHPPIANIQSSQTSVKVGGNVTLDGTASSDPDADILAYHWSLISKPQGSNVIVPDSNISQVSFVPDQSGAYVVQLIVTDPSNAASQPAIITIQAIPADEPPVTPQSGFIHGKVIDSGTELPIYDAHLTIPGIQGIVHTDTNGQFSFPTLGSGEYTIKFSKDNYITSERTVRVVTTRNASVDVVYMKLLDPAMTTITNAGGTHSNAAGTLQLTFPANALPAGVSSIDVRTTLYEKERELLSPLPRTTIFTYAFKVLPDRIKFTQPVSGRLSNSLGFAPGTSIPIGYYNPDTHKWEDTGTTGIVSSDGAWVDFQLTHFCAYDINLPPMPLPQDRAPNASNETKSNDDKSKNCAKAGTSLIFLKSGELIQDHALPSCRVFNQDYGLQFIYNSRCASPATLLSVETNLDTAITNVPQTCSMKVSIEGNSKLAYFTGVSGKTRMSYLFDATNANGEFLATGSYPYSIELANNYTNMTYGAANYFGGPATGNTGVPTRQPVPMYNTIKGRISVNNQRQSPFGSGWILSDLQRLHPDPDGVLSVTEGDGSVKMFRKQIGGGQHLAVTNSFVTVSIALNNGDGTFQNPVEYPSGAMYSYHIVAGDFDQDGITDLAVTNLSDNTVSILLGNGNGTFQSSVAYAAGNYPYHIVAGDFDQDGVIDLAVTNYYVGTVTILLGNGDGSFQSPIAYQSGSNPFSIAAGDFNKDGVIDLAVTNFSNNIGSINIVSILLGNGDGSFQNPVACAAGSNPFIIVTGDFNQDGVTDLAVTNLNGVSILLGNGDGSFQSPVEYPIAEIGYIVTGDFNQDGVTDLALTSYFFGTVSILLGNGDGSFQSPVTYPSGINPKNIITGDFNLDGVIDLAVTNSNYYADTVTILLGNGDGTFQEAPQHLFDGALYRFGIVAFNITTESTGSYPGNAYVSGNGDYSYIIKNPDGTFTRIDKEGTKVFFNALGLQTQIADRNANSTTYEYIDANGDGTQDELSTITLPTGQQYHFVYSAGKLFSITDPADRITQFTINSQGDLKQIINPDNTTKQYDYNNYHLMTKKTDERGFVTDYDYDNYGMITQTRSPEREVTDIDANGNVSSLRLRETRNYIPSNSIKLINDLLSGSGIESNPADPARPEEIKEKYIDGRGNTWAYKTNKFGGRLQFTDPLNNVTNYERDGNSNLRELTRANGSVQHIKYDSRGNVTATTEDYNTAATKIKYDLNFSQPISMTDPLGNITNIEYDAKGNPNKITDSSGTITSMEYNARGQVTKVVSAFGTTLQTQTTFVYDPATFNLLTITDPLNHVTTFAYNTAGNITRITDAKGKVSSFTYDLMNRVKTATDADSKITTYYYDNLGNLISVTDANNHTTTFVYDEQNQLIKTINSLNEQKLYAYDINRNLSMVVTPNGSQIKLYNNAANIVEKKFLPEGVVDYTYDGEYNLTKTSNADSDLSFTYDPLNRLTQAQTAGTVQPATSISYAYDLNNNLTTMINPAGTITNYIYDTMNRLADIKDQSNQVISHYNYDALSRRIQKQTAVGSSQMAANYQYDLASKLLSITNLPTTISDSYTYDNVGNRLSLIDNNGLHSYIYDNLYRVTDSSNPVEHYSYDPVGNRNPLTQSYDSGNQLLDDGIYTYTYDHDGNMTKKVKNAGGETTTYTYNSEDQLIGVVTPTQTTSYKYDALGRRIEKNVGGTITRYVYNGEDIIQELDGNNQVVATYTHGPGIDEPICLEKNGEKYYYVSDGLGSITAIVNSTGTVVSTYRYDSFGDIISQTGSLNQPFTYTGREYDSETGLYYLRARYYDPHTGRFLQQDPIFDENLYSYCANNPLNYVDPFGLRHGGRGTGDGGGSYNVSWNSIYTAVSRTGSTYYGQWAGTIKSYAPGWTRGISNATNMQSAFQSIGLLLGGLGYVDLIAQVQAGCISQNQAITAVAIHTLMLGSKAAAGTGLAAAGFFVGGPAGSVVSAVAGGAIVSGQIDAFESHLYGQIGVK